MADRTGFQNTNLQAQADATWQQHNSAFFTPSSLFTPLQLFTPSFLFMPSSLVCSGAMEGPNCTCTNQKDFCSLTVGICCSCFVPVSFYAKLCNAHSWEHKQAVQLVDFNCLEMYVFAALGHITAIVTTHQTARCCIQATKHSAATHVVFS